MGSEIEQENLPFVDVTIVSNGETEEESVIDIRVTENPKTLAELLYDCYASNEFGFKLIHPKNKDFIIYFESDAVFVKNLKDNENVDITLTEVQCIWLALEIKEVNYFAFETLGYEKI